MTSPSTGTRSPGSTRTTSPARTVAVRTITSSAAGAAAAAPPPSAAALGRGAAPGSSTSLALSGMRRARAVRSAEAAARARASRLRPSSTKASSMTGSSRKEGSREKPGSSAEAAPAAKEVDAPSAISEFMLGAPLQGWVGAFGQLHAEGEGHEVQQARCAVHGAARNDRLACCQARSQGQPWHSGPHLNKERAPSTRSGRPGPSSAAAPSTPLTQGLPSACMNSAWRGQG